HGGGRGAGTRSGNSGGMSVQGRDAHGLLRDQTQPLPAVAGVRASSAGTRSRAIDAYRRRVRSGAAGPAANAYSGALIGRPVALSTMIGSTAAPVSVSTSCTLAPSGAKCLLPQASRAISTGRKSRPRAVGRYSSRGGRSL